MTAAQRSNRDVFINCPYDAKYQRLFETIVFTSIACGYNPRCAREVTDASERLRFILKLARTCRLGIHDLSRARAGNSGDYARFNLPFELGLQWAFKTKGKRIIVFESGKFDLQKAFSDFNALDPRAHGNRAERIVIELREFFGGDAPRKQLPGAKRLKEMKKEFDAALPLLCSASGVHRRDIRFADYVSMAADWLKAQRSAAGLSKAKPSSRRA